MPIFLVNVEEENSAIFFIEAASREEAQEIAEELPFEKDMFEETSFVTTTVDKNSMNEYDLKSYQGYPLWKNGADGKKWHSIDTPS